MASSVKTEVSPLRGPLIQMATGVAVTLAVLGTAWFSSTFGPQPTPVPLPPAPIIEVIEEVDPPAPLAGPDAPVPVGGIAEFSIPASVVNPQWLIVPEVPYRCYESHDDPHKIVVETATPGKYRVIVAGIDDESVSSILWHRELTVGPKVIPPEPGPDPPRPTPPVVEGNREIVIIRETADTTSDQARLLVMLRVGVAAEYLTAKGHKLAILDDDAVDENGQPSKYVAEWLKIVQGIPLPAMAIVDKATQTVLDKRPLPATPDEFLDAVRKAGG
jgi:hypothetical protein